MKGAALIVQIECAVMVVSIRKAHTGRQVSVKVRSDWGSLIDIQRVIMEQWEHAHDLRDDKEHQ